MAENHDGKTLAVESVSVRFGAVRALDDVSFTVGPGTIHAVIGPNGAGKSTLFNVLTGVYASSRGDVRYGDDRLTGLRPHRVAQLGLARTFQNIELSRSTVLDNLLLGRHLATRTGLISQSLRLPRAVREDRENRRHIDVIADYLGLSDKLHVRADELAYGDQKRVDLGRALATSPEVLLLDEPVAGMSRSERAEIADLIRRIRDDMHLTIILVEHDMPMVMGIADHCTVLDFGRVIADGEPRAIRTHPAVIEAYLGGSPQAATLQGAQP